MNALSRVALAAVLVVAGCSTAPASSPASPAPVATRSVNAAFGGTDLAWIEINIAMDEQLIPLLDIVGDRTRNDDVLALARQVEAFTYAELNTLRELHDQAGLPAENPHKGMPMPGMVTPEQVTEAGKLTGPAFDKVLVQRLEEHLEQGRNLATSEEKSGVEPQTQALALQVARTRDETLATITKMGAAG